ncbi:heme-binding protein [Nonomuraea sp. NN258]|uniref:GlcG/HbpS family heme-binding protein n=1 Tax=Nonomuraea antri TaxID=2730852 RepID=UPI0015696048|nr:heme-binding protein [Nonomuraea antri]NRQ33164.1 heme-binding protein [Nonomuraea antri]
MKIAAAALAGLLLVGGGAATAAQAASQSEPASAAVTQQTVLSADAALRIAEAVQKEAAKQKQRVTVAIVDRSGATRLILKGDGSGPQTEESAKRKAFTAVSMGRPTSELAKGITGAGPSIADIPGTLFLAGGVPVASGGAPIAGIGVGGAPSGDIDEAIARAGLKAVDGKLG